MEKWWLEHHAQNYSDRLLKGVQVQKTMVGSVCSRNLVTFISKIGIISNI